MTAPPYYRELAQAYVEMVELHRRGATTEATDIYHRLAHEVRTRSDVAWAKAQQCIADGNHDDALDNLRRILELHAQNFANLKVPISKTVCFDQIAALFRARQQPIAAAAAAALAAREGDSFYRPALSCQIPILGGLYETLFGHHTHQCIVRHQGNPRVSVLDLAIGPAETTIRMWDNGPCSTGSADEMAVNKVNGWEFVVGLPEIEVRQKRLDQVLTEAGIAPEFDLLVIDVDGMEEQVFESFSLADWRPRHLIVELIEQSPGFVGHDGLIAASARVREAIQRDGYETIYRDSGNTIFRHGAAPRPAGS